jgi:hypothetical protein
MPASRHREPACGGEQLPVQSQLAEPGLNTVVDIDGFTLVILGAGLESLCLQPAGQVNHPLEQRGVGAQRGLFGPGERQLLGGRPGLLEHADDHAVAGVAPRVLGEGEPRVIRRDPDRADPQPSRLLLEPARQLRRVGAGRLRRGRRIWWVLGVMSLGVVDRAPGPEQAPRDRQERPPVVRRHPPHRLRVRLEPVVQRAFGEGLGLGVVVAADAGDGRELGQRPGGQTGGRYGPGRGNLERPDQARAGQVANPAEPPRRHDPAHRRDQPVIQIMAHPQHGTPEGTTWARPRAALHARCPASSANRRTCGIG